MRSIYIYIFLYSICDLFAIITPRSVPSNAKVTSLLLRPLPADTLEASTGAAVEAMGYQWGP